MCSSEQSMAHTKEKESFIQKVFYEISLEKDPALWQDDTDTVDKNVERIRWMVKMVSCTDIYILTIVPRFLAEFPQTQYKAQLDKGRSTTRKNEGLARALKEKGNKQFGAGDTFSALALYNQALCYTR